MKKFIFIFACAALAACSSDKPGRASTDLVNIDATADSSKITEHGKAVIRFNKDLHDFGTLTEGETLEYDFIFTNVGDQDLLIANAQASCGCTVPDYPKEPIKPGAEGRIKVKFNSDKRVGAFEKQVAVSANTDPSETVIRIKGVVRERASSTPGTGIH